MNIFLCLSTGGYPLLKALIPAEKNRNEYEKMLDYVSKLLDFYHKDFTIAKLIKIKSVLKTAIIRNESNGYLPLISVCVVEALK